MDLKGKSERVVAYRLSVSRPTPRDTGADSTRRWSERERELAALHAGVSTGEHHGGRASCSRSSVRPESARAASSRSSSAAVRDVRACSAAAVPPYGEGITYLPIAEIVRQAAGIDELANGDGSGAIEAWWPACPNRPPLRRGLAGLIGLEGSAAQEELVWAFRRMLERLADETADHGPRRRHSLGGADAARPGRVGR